MLAAVCASISAQTYPSGFRSYSFANPTNQGPRLLQATVHYPARHSGKNAPVAPGQFPAIVLLAGLARSGSDYRDIGSALARGGFVSVMADPSMSAELQFQYGTAALPALVRENSQGKFLLRKLYPDRIALVGHSMGASSTVRVLASNPGYRAGVCYGTWINSIVKNPVLFAPRVKVPLLMIVGEGDKITPWRTDSLPVYEKLKNYRQLKTMALLGRQAHHANVIAWSYVGATPVDREVFNRSTAITRGFLGRFLRNISQGSENVVGRTVRAGKHVSKVFAEAEVPLYWRTGSIQRGRVTHLHTLATGGVFSFFIGLPGKPLRTPFGDLLLQPYGLQVLASGWTKTGGLLSATLAIPKSIKNISVRVQGLATGHKSGLRLGRAIDIKLTGN